MTRFAVDAPTLLGIAAGDVKVAPVEALTRAKQRELRRRDSNGDVIVLAGVALPSALILGPAPREPRRERNHPGASRPHWRLRPEGATA